MTRRSGRAWKSATASAFMLFALVFLTACGADRELAALEISRIINPSESVSYDETGLSDESEYLETETETEPAAPEASEEVQDTETSSAVEAETSENYTETVFWVAGGEVWHIRSDCSSLSRSKNIQSGSVSDAVSAGKDRVCKRCGKSG